MSMTSIEACTIECPKSDWTRLCVGNKCPNWIVERTPNGAIACTERTWLDGRYNPDFEKEESAFLACSKKYNASECIYCTNAYGHCAG